MSRSKEIAGERLTSWADNGRACRGCIFAEEAPDKCICNIYPYPKTKPDSVYLEGCSCKYHRTAVLRILDAVNNRVLLPDGLEACVEGYRLENAVEVLFLGGKWIDNRDREYTPVYTGGELTGFTGGFNNGATGANTKV